MKTKILIIGYGSIGRLKHTKYALELGYTPVVLTKYPDSANGVIFINKFESLKNYPDLKHAVIATPTSRHLSDLESLVKHSNIKNILLEKPVEMNLEKSEKINILAKQNGLNIKVGYCLRYVNALRDLKDFIYTVKSEIRLVKVVAGQYLPDWRPDSDYRKSYSSSKGMGGGVHLDLSHELDYIFWMFGYPENVLTCIKRKISCLEIDSIDYFQTILDYESFIVDIQLDYFRKASRKISVLGENKNLAECDFVKRKLYYNEKSVLLNRELFNLPDNYKKQLSDFVLNKKNNVLTSLDEGMKILKYL